MRCLVAKGDLELIFLPPHVEHWDYRHVALCPWDWAQDIVHAKASAWSNFYLEICIGTHYVDQTVLELSEIFLPLSSKLCY